MQFSWKNPLKALPVLLLLAAYAGTAWGLAGNVQFVIGDVKLINSVGQAKALQKGAEVNEGDRIVTGDGASAQIKMVDGGFIAVRPNTDMGFDTYRYNGKEDGSENAVVSLLHGGFRTITGIIGRTNKQNYLVKTATSTIGIRGTDHEPMVILAPPPGRVAIAPPGTYDKVNVGVAFIRNEAGSIDIQRNQVGYVPDAKAPPRILPGIPSFYKPTPAPGPQKAKDEAKDDGKKEGGQTAAAGPAKSGEEQKASGEIRNTAVVDPTSSIATAPAMAPYAAATTTPVAIAPVVAITATGASGATLNTTTQTTTTTGGVTTPITPTVAGPTPAVPITGGSGNYRFLVGGAQSLSPYTYYSSYSLPTGSVTDKLNFLFDTSGNLMSLKSADYSLSDRGTSGPPSFTAGGSVPNTGTAGGIPTAPLSSTTVAIAGGTAPDGNYNDAVNGIRMGRYAGGTITTTDNSVAASPVVYTTTLGSNSFIWSTRELPPSIPITGTFEYTPTYSTKPIDSFGNVGTLNYASLTANFSTQTVSPSVGVSINNQNLSAAATNVPINSQFGFDVTSSSTLTTGGGLLQVTCTGSNCAPAPCAAVNVPCTNPPAAITVSGGYGGRINGGFAGPGTAAGAFFRYIFNTSYTPGAAAGAAGGVTINAPRTVNDYIQGLVAFTKGTDVAPQAFSTSTSGSQLVSSAYFIPASVATGSFDKVQTQNFWSLPGGYTSAFGTGSPNTVTDSDPGNPTGARTDTLTGGTVVQAPTNATSFASTGISFGRYTGGTLSGTDWQGNSFSYPNMGNYAWVKGPDTAMFADAMRGTAKYVYDGGTLPATNNGATTGTVNSAVLAVNFNSSSVGLDLSVSVPGKTWTATTNTNGVLSTGTATPATSMRMDSGSFSGSTFQLQSNPLLHQNLYVKLNNGVTNASNIAGSVSGQLTGSNLSGAGMSYAFQDMTSAPGPGVSGALAFALSSYTNNAVTTTGTTAIDPNNVSYALAIAATGLNNDPNAGPKTPAAVDPDQYLTQVQGRALAMGGRTDMGANGMPTVWDGVLPLTTAPTCSPTPCTAYVNEVPARFIIDPKNFVAPGVTPTVGQIVLPAGATIATVLETGFDAATGLRWGRYGGGVVAIFDRVGGGISPRTVDISSNNWHFILGPTQTGPVSLPVTGTYTYANVGGTSPTDNIGSAAGKLNAATLVADFAAQTVNAGVNLTVNGQTWAAGATAVPIQQRVFFETSRSTSGSGSLNVCTGASCGTTTLPTTSTANTSGRIAGGFVGTSGQGVGMAYSFNQGGITGTTVSGVTAFKR